MNERVEILLALGTMSFFSHRSKTGESRSWCCHHEGERREERDGFIFLTKGDTIFDRRGVERSSCVAGYEPQLLGERGFDPQTLLKKRGILGCGF